MSLKYILQEWSKETGQPANSTNQRANALDKINKAARELYDGTDLPGCLREQVFDMNFALKEVTLPWYVDQIRAVRHYNSRNRIKLNDMRPRYAVGNWQQPILSFRVKRVLALGNNLTNEAPLTFTLAGSNTEDFNIYLKTSTSYSSSTVEKMTFPTGVITLNSVLSPTSFPGITNIEKDRLTEVDLKVTDASGTIIAEIPNSELASRYTLLQVIDETVIFVQVDPCYEILYKWKFSPLLNDFDNFPADGYDDIIVWKSVSNFWKRKPGGSEQVTIAEQTLAKLLADKVANSEAGEELELNFGRNRFQDVMTGGFPTGLYNDIPYRTI